MALMPVSELAQVTNITLRNSRPECSHRLSGNFHLDAINPVRKPVNKPENSTDFSPCQRP